MTPTRAAAIAGLPPAIASSSARLQACPTMLQAPARSWLGKRLGVQLAGAGIEKIEHRVVARLVADRPPQVPL